MNIGHRLKKLREDSGMTQTELASKSNVNRGLLCQIENGQRDNVKTNTLYKIACALKCDIRDFFKEE